MIIVEFIKIKRELIKNILDNIKLLQKNGIKLAGIECTYNYSHVSENVSISDLIEFISNEIGTSNIHIAPLMEIGGVKGNLWQKYSTGMIEAIDDMFEKKVFTETTKVMLIRLLEKHDIDFYCGAGITQFSVDVDGELYPCFMFFGEENFKMGNVNNKMFDIKKLNIRKEKYIKNSKLSKKECINCHIKPVCGGCIGSNYFQFKDIGYINKADCNCKEKIFDKILLNIYKKNKSTVEGIK